MDLRLFKKEFKKSNEKEIEKFDIWFMDYFENYLENIAKTEGLTKKQREKFIDIMYKVLFVKKDFDERYDNVLIHDALKRVGWHP